MPKKTSSKGLVARDKDYQNLLSDLKSIITKGQYKAYKAVDNIRVRKASGIVRRAPDIRKWSFDSLTDASKYFTAKIRQKTNLEVKTVLFSTI